MGDSRKHLRRIKTIQCEPLVIVPRCRKFAYRSFAAAARARTELYRVNRQAKKNRGALDVYYCPGCDAWHVGHAKKRRK